MPTSDSELLMRWRAGERRAGEELFGRYFAMVERFFLNKVTDGIDDLVQETFLGCLRNRDRVVESEKFRSYLFAVAYNVLAGHLRKRYRHGNQVDLDSVSVHDLSPSPTSVIVRRDEQRLLLEALRSIPVVHQVILELHYWESLTTNEIAEVLNIPPGTVKSRLQKARVLLEKALARLAESPALLQSTHSRLEDWAARCRRDLESRQPT